MGRAPRPRPSRGSHRCTRTRRAARRPRASRGSLQPLEHFARFGLDVHLQHLRGLHDHHQAVVVGRDVSPQLHWLGHEDVREFVPHDVGRHRFLRRGDACVQGLVQERLGELAVEDRRHGAGAVVQDCLHAQVRLAFDLAVEPARAFPQDSSAFGAPVDEARAFPQVDQAPSRKSTTRTGVGLPTYGWPGPDLNSGSASGASFPTAVRTPKFTWTWPRYSFVYAFWTRSTSPLAKGIGSGSHAVNGTVAVASPRMPDRIVFVSCPWGGTSFSYTATTRARRFTLCSPGTSSRIVLLTPTARVAGFPPCFFTIDRFAVSKDTR